MTAPAHVQRRSAVVLLLLFLAACSLLQAQYGYNVWTVDEGLPQNSIRGIAQTPEGYIWIPTFNGLIRFDGVRFTLFNKGNTKGIHSNRFSSIYQGRAGDLWLVTDGDGLTRYHNGSFETYGKEHGIVDGTARGITGDGQGHFWILSGNSIEQWDEASERFNDVTPNGSSVNYNGFTWEDAGFWGIDQAGLHCFAKGQFSTHALPAGLQRASNVALDRDGTLWLGTPDGKNYGIRDGRLLPGTGPFTTEYVDRHGHAWSVRIGPRLTRSLTFDSSGRTTEISPTHFYEDRQDNLWLGTEGQGLYRLQPQLIRTYSQEQGLADRDVYPIYEDTSGAVWIGAWHGGVSRYAEGKFTTYGVRDGLPSGLPTALYGDREGRLWVGAHGGLSSFSDGRFQHAANPILPDRAVVQAILEDRGGTLWFGTSRGLVSYKDGASRVFTRQDGLPTEDIEVLLESASGDLWIGGNGGVARLHNGQFTAFTEKDGLPSNTVWSIYEDSEGVVWIGTYDGGLARYKDGKLTVIGVREGLYSDGVYQILEDSRGYFWISCSRGIYRVSKRELNELAAGTRSTVTSVAYGKIDGMLDLVCNGGVGGAGIKTRDGKMWFPTQDGVAVFDPSGVVTDSREPPVLIESVLLDRKPVSSTGTVRVPPGESSLEIQYTALSFDKPRQMHFRYQMEGLDAGWTDAGPRRTAYYSHLPPGHYTFRVIAANGDGVWNDAGKAMPVVVLAPFYKTGWFGLILLLIAMSLIAGLFYYRAVQHQRAQRVQRAFSQQLIASQEGERKRIAAELHDSLGQRLVVINNLALFSLKNGASRAVEGEWGQTAREISDEALLALDETRSISYNLRPFQLDRLGLRRAIAALARNVEKASGVRISTEIDDIDEVFPEELRINLYRILQEGLQNIVKHSHASEASVRVEHADRKVLLTIQDNGRGFMPGNAVAEPGQGGFGLTGMTERAVLLGGTLKVRSEPGQGTVVTMDIALNKEK